MKDKKLQVIGRNVLMDIVGHVDQVPAKVDTGADSSSIWASHIEVDDKGVLSFALFGPSSPFYTGEIITRKSFQVAVVRSSNRIAQVRCRTDSGRAAVGQSRLRAEDARLAGDRGSAGEHGRRGA